MRPPVSLLLLVATTACTIDNGLEGKDGYAGFEEDTSTPDPGIDDTAVDTEDTDPPPLKDCGDLDRTVGSVVVDESCETEAIVGTFTPVIEWRRPEIGDAYTTPAIGQLTDDNGDGVVDRDDMPDIVVANTSGVLYALSGDGSGVLWYGGSFGSEPMSPAIGDIDGDGWPDVVGSGVGGTTAFEGATGAVKWTAAAYTGGVSPQCGAVAVYDLDADGSPEVVIGRRILDGATGAQVGQGAYGDGSGHGWAAPISVAADIDQDGILEVVVGNAAYHSDGSALWSNGQSDGYVAVGNFDSDPYGEIVVTSQGSVRLMDDDGSVIWSRSGVTGSTSGTPTVADFDGDGEPEIGVAGQGSYTVFETDGTTKWQRSTSDYSSGFTGSSVFDFEGDGAAEAVYADENDVFVFDGATGAIKLQESNHSSATCSEYPAIADVDNDGHAEIIFTSSQYSGTERGVTVIGDADDSWMAGRPVWNQHAYAITQVNDDASLPAPGETNWLTYNNFRSGDLVAGTGGVLADAVPLMADICNLECDRGRLYVTVAVGNAGMGEIPAGVPLSVYDVRETTEVYLGTRWTTTPIASGDATEAMLFELYATDIQGSELRFVADDDGTGAVLDECHEDNNVLSIADELCP